MDIDWSAIGAVDCIRLTGLVGDHSVRVSPATAAKTGTAPPMAGRLVRDGEDLCFVPRFPFLAGTAYTVVVDGVAVVDLERDRPAPGAGTDVRAIYPTAAVVPGNLLRCYIWFTAPMSEGYAAGHVSLLDDSDELVPDALLATGQELWDPTRQRLTVLLDPARIKRGLAAQDAIGYPLRSGHPVRLVVGAGFADAAGQPLVSTVERRYQVGADERRRVEPRDWTLTVPAVDTHDALRVAFDRPLDHGLLARCLRVLGPDGRPVRGTVQLGSEERGWQLTPAGPWSSGRHELVVDPVLEDVAGNSVQRVFDRDLSRVGDQPGSPDPVRLAFRPSR